MRYISSKKSKTKYSFLSLRALKFLAGCLVGDLSRVHRRKSVAPDRNLSHLPINRMHQNKSTALQALCSTLILLPMRSSPNAMTVTEGLKNNKVQAAATAAP